MSKTNACSINDTVSLLASAVSSPTGLDGGLMAIQYASPLVAAALLKIIQVAKEHPQLLTVNSKRLADLAGAVVRAGGSIGEARTISRTFGLLPMLSWFLKIHPRPLSALRNLILRPTLANLDPRNPKVLNTIRVLLLSSYYVLEHRAWLGSKGVLNLTPEQIGWAMQWSVRVWAVDVFIVVFGLVKQYASLKARTRALRAQSSEKDSDDVSAKAALKAEWGTWQEAALINFGWVPLTLHWSTPGGLWTNPLITAAIGSVVAYGKCVRAINAA